MLGKVCCKCREEIKEGSSYLEVKHRIYLKGPTGSNLSQDGEVTFCSRLCLIRYCADTSEVNPPGVSDELVDRIIEAINERATRGVVINA